MHMRQICLMHSNSHDRCKYKMKEEKPRNEKAKNKLNKNVFQQNTRM